MLRTRIIPCLLLKNQGLVKTVKFKNTTYVGDPINAIRIFNEKEVDELIFLDINSWNENREPSYNLISDIAKECFMPFCYGGGVRTIEQIQKILKLGVEKVAINSAAFDNPVFIKEACRVYGSSTIVASIDVRKNLFGKYQVFTRGGSFNTKLDPIAYAKKMEQLGVGELLVNSIDRDGTMNGYDISLLNSISSNVNVPIIACGGAGGIGDFKEASQRAGVSAVAAGSMFVFHGKHKAVLITYPSQSELIANEL